MTVKELREALKEFSDDLPVLMNGVESGYDGFCYPQQVEVKQFPEHTYHDGEFQIVDDDTKQIDAVLLIRTTRH